MSTLTVEDVIATVQARDIEYSNDTTFKLVKDAVEHGFDLLRWQRLSRRDAYDMATDQLGDDLFCDLTRRQADDLTEAVEVAVTAAIERFWQALQADIAVVAVLFHEQHPNAPLRRDRPRVEDAEVDEVTP